MSSADVRFSQMATAVRFLEQQPLEDRERLLDDFCQSAYPVRKKYRAMFRRQIERRLEFLGIMI